MKVLGKPFQRGGVLFFPCDDGKDHTAEEIGRFHGVSGMCFYQRWNRYKDHDDPRLYANGKLKSGGRRGALDAKPTAEWLAMTRPAGAVDNIPVPTEYDNMLFPRRAVKEELTVQDVLADIERRHLKTKGRPVVHHAFAIGDSRR